MEKCLAFVLGGGGGRGAMQVGALRALFEAGYKPDLLVGTSIGAVNGAAIVQGNTFAGHANHVQVGEIAAEPDVGVDHAPTSAVIVQREGARLIKEQFPAAMYIKAGFDTGFLRYVYFLVEAA